MAQSMNSSIDLAVPATSFAGLGTYGTMMVGNVALEFYNDRNVEDYIQIPWTEVEGITAEVLFGGHIPRFAVVIRGGGRFAFSTRDNKAVLRAIRVYIPSERMIRSPSFLAVIRLGLRRLGRIVMGKA